MKASFEGTSGSRRWGASRRSIWPLAYLVAMPYFLVVRNYPSVVDPAQKVALLVSNHDSM